LSFITTIADQKTEMDKTAISQEFGSSSSASHNPIIISILGLVNSFGLVVAKFLRLILHQEKEPNYDDE